MFEFDISSLGEAVSMTRIQRNDLGSVKIREPFGVQIANSSWSDEETEPSLDPTSSTAVAEEVLPEPVVRPTRETEAEKEKGKPKRQPRYHVLLWNDDDHSHDYVIRMLKELFGHPTERGMQLAVEVDTRGKAIVFTTTMERAELKRDQIHAYGKDADIKGCKGSMSSSIEPEIS
jgi:ATP-dependent Clp protease adaptor protein ClpS